MQQKIIHLVLGKANPNRMNGVNKVAHNHATYLHQIGKDVEIWGITKTPNGDVVPRSFPTRLFRLQPFYRDLDPALLYALHHLPKNTIFHVHGAFISDFYKITRELNYMKIPYIYTPHGAFNEIALEKSKWIKKVYIQRYEKTIMRDAKWVHLLGQSEFDNIDKIVSLDNKVVIPNGQNFDELKFDFHKMVRRNSPVFGFCGRLDIFYKGLDLLINGFAGYVRKGGSGDLWLIGDGPDRAALEKLVKENNCKDRVVFMGAHYGKDKLNRISNMNLFCHPSRSEGSPTAVLEAAALKRPLLVSTATNVGELVEQYKGGIHLKKNNALEIEKAMLTFDKLFEEGKHLEMGDRAQKMVVDEFDWTTIVHQLEALYEESKVAVFR